MNWIKTEWKECSTFFYEHFLKVSCIVGVCFLLSAVLLWIGLLSQPTLLKELYDGLVAIFDQKGMDLDTISAFALFKNNTLACLYCILQGCIPFFYLDVFAFLINSASLGIIGAVYTTTNMSLLVLAAGLIPHGIFELPAIFISLAMGFKTCSLFGKRITGKIESLDVKGYMFNVFRVFVWIVIPLLLVAAVIEAYITPICMNFFM